MIDFKTVTDALDIVETASNALVGTDGVKASNDAKFLAAQVAKATSDQADLDAVTSWKESLDALATAVAVYVADAKGSR